MEALFLVRPKLGRYRNFKPNFKRLHRSNNTQNVFNQGKIGARLNWLAAPIVCGSEPVMGALENSTRNNHSSVGSSSDKCAFSNYGNSAEGVTKKNVKSLAMLCLIPVSLLLCQSLKYLNLKFPSHVNVKNLKMSLMKIFCLKLLSVFCKP